MALPLGQAEYEILDSVEILELGLDGGLASWKTLPAMNQARAGFSLNRIGGSFIAFGGHSDQDLKEQINTEIATDDQQFNWKVVDKNACYCLK